MTEPTLSIVMPAFDEEANVGEAVREALAAAEPLVGREGVELVAVDDGSRDGTGSLLDQAAAADPRVRVLHRENGGHGPALITGLDAARGGWLLLLDSDRQVPLDTLPALWSRALEAGGLVGIRSRREDPWIRRQVSRAMAGWIRLLFAIRLVDGGTPLKILPAARWREIRPALSDGFPIPAVALAVHAVRTGPVAQVPVPHRPRLHGRSTLHGLGLANFALRSLAALAGLRLRLLRKAT